MGIVELEFGVPATRIIWGNNGESKIRGLRIALKQEPARRSPRLLVVITITSVATASCPDGVVASGRGGGGADSSGSIFGSGCTSVCPCALPPSHRAAKFSSSRIARQPCATLCARRLRGLTPECHVRPSHRTRTAAQIARGRTCRSGSVVSAPVS